MANQAIDRNSIDVAKEIITRLTGRKSLIRPVLAQILKSCAAANEVAPDAWAVTLNFDFVRINVGQAEVFLLGPQHFFMNCSAAFGVPPFTGIDFEAAEYRSVPGSQCRFKGSLSLLQDVPEPVMNAHLDFVRRAACTQSGKPRKGSAFTRYHSPGLLEYANTVVSSND